MSARADKVSHASLNSLYVKAQELDRGQNAFGAPSYAPPGATCNETQSHASDAGTHASTHASDADAHASDAETHVSDFDAQTHASEW